MRHVLRPTSASVLLALTMATAQAQGTFGMAGVLCSQYSKAARSSDILYHQASQWLLGYVSGMNAAMKNAKGTTPISNLTNDQVLIKERRDSRLPASNRRLPARSHE